MSYLGPLGYEWSHNQNLGLFPWIEVKYKKVFNLVLVTTSRLYFWWGKRDSFAYPSKEFKISGNWLSKTQFAPYPTSFGPALRQWFSNPSGVFILNSDTHLCYISAAALCPSHCSGYEMGFECLCSDLKSNMLSSTCDTELRLALSLDSDASK